MKDIKAFIIQLPKITDPRGNLTFIESQNHIPFEIKRVYWIYDVPGGETRGGHAFKEQDEFIISISGSFDVLVNDGFAEQRFHLNRSYEGLLIPSGTWRSMENFSTNSLALVIASTYFDEKDYIRSYTDFVKNRLKIEQIPNTITTKTVIADLNKGTIGNTVYDCKVIDLEKNHRDKGNITVIESKVDLPFNMQRIYYLYDVPGGEERGGHAHKELSQLIVAAGGSFDVVLNDGENQKTITLNRPYQGLYIVPGIWRELNNFSSGSTCLVLASETYNENDYIRDFDNFTVYKTLTV